MSSISFEKSVIYVFRIQYSPYFYKKQGFDDDMFSSSSYRLFSKQNQVIGKVKFPVLNCFCYDWWAFILRYPIIGFILAVNSILSIFFAHSIIEFEILKAIVLKNVVSDRLIFIDFVNKLFERCFIIIFLFNVEYNCTAN